MKDFGRISTFVSLIIYSFFSLISLKQCFIVGAEEKILNISTLMYMPFTLGLLFTFDIFFSLFLNERKESKYLPLIYLLFLAIILSAIIIKYWETPLSILIIFALIEPLKNKFLLKDVDNVHAVNIILFVSSFCLLFLAHVFGKTFKNPILDKYLYGFLMYGVMAAINFYLFNKNLKGRKKIN